jgi:hypothetical protein
MLFNNINSINFNSTKNNKSLTYDFKDIDRTNNNSPDNSFINSPLEENNLLFFINSSLEQHSDLQLFVVSLLIIDLGILLLTFLIFINIIIRLFKLEDKEFIKNRPELYKIIILSLKMRDYTSLFMIIFILFGSGFMLVALSYLLHFLKLLNV